MNCFSLLGAGSLALLLAANLLAEPSPGAAPTAGTGGPSITAAFWNIKWFPGGRPNAYKSEETRQVRAVHADISKLAADVIGFEEVRDWNSAALAIETLPGFKVDVCANLPPREGQTDTQQVAIASRLEPISAWSEAWKTGGVITPPRGFAFAAYQIAPRQLLLVYALHLKSNRGAIVEDIAIREESIRQLLVHMKDMEAAYRSLGSIAWVVGGDFNTAPDDVRFKKDKTSNFLMTNGFLWTWEKIPMAQRITMPSEGQFPAACFDHIFYRGLALKKAQLLPASKVSSDHRAVRAEFAFDSIR